MGEQKGRLTHRNKYGHWMSRDGFPLYLRPDEIELTPQRNNAGVFKCWKKKIGRFRTASGGIEDKAFYLGTNQIEAKFRAACYLEVWETTAGDPAQRVWTQPMLDRVDRLIQQKLAVIRWMDRQAATWQDRAEEARRLYLSGDGDAKTQPRLPGDERSVSPDDASTLYGAIDAYVASLSSASMGQKSKDRIKEIMAALKHYRDDAPLSAIDYEWCRGLRDFLVARPTSRQYDAMLKMLRRKMKDQSKRDAAIKRFDHLKENPKWLPR